MTQLNQGNPGWRLFQQIPTLCTILKTTYNFFLLYCIGGYHRTWHNFFIKYYISLGEYYNDMPPPLKKFSGRDPQNFKVLYCIPSKHHVHQNQCQVQGSHHIHHTQEWNILTPFKISKFSVQDNVCQEFL